MRAAPRKERSAPGMPGIAGEWKEARRPAPDGEGRRPGRPAAFISGTNVEGVGFFAYPADFEDSGMSGMTLQETGLSDAGLIT